MRRFRHGFTKKKHMCWGLNSYIFSIEWGINSSTQFRRGLYIQFRKVGKHPNDFHLFLPCVLFIRKNNEAICVSHIFNVNSLHSTPNWTRTTSSSQRSGRVRRARPVNSDHSCWMHLDGIASQRLHSVGLSSVKKKNSF